MGFDPVADGVDDRRAASPPRELWYIREAEVADEAMVPRIHPAPVESSTKASTTSPASGGESNPESVLPRTWRALHRLASSGQTTQALALHRQLIPLLDLAFDKFRLVPKELIDDAFKDDVLLVAGTATFKGGPGAYAANIAALKGQG